MKDLWRGAFRVGNTVSVLYAYAHTEKQAKVIMCRRIAEKDGVPLGVVLGAADVMITKEIEVKEVIDVESRDPGEQRVEEAQHAQERGYGGHQCRGGA